MKLGKIMLSAGAVAVTVISAFAFTNQFAAGTLFTDTTGTLNRVNCQRINTGHGTCPSVTYYTAQGAKLGKINAFATGEQ